MPVSLAALSANKTHKMLDSYPRKGNNPLDLLIKLIWFIRKWNLEDSVPHSSKCNFSRIIN